MLGANGQVGAELCMLLRQAPGLTIIPVCRTRSGSAFLRWNGVACRHGSVVDQREAPRLIGDCDVVLNLALAGGSPSEIQKQERRIVDNAFRYAKPGATFIHCSTQDVYGDPSPDRAIRWSSAYGRTKLATERFVGAQQRRIGNPTYVLRLGHVCGELQNITADIRQSLRSGTTILPAEDLPSNTVYTATIADAVLHIIGNQARPGTYDLMNVPQWTWLEVHRYEARKLGIATPIPIAESLGTTPANAWRSVVRGSSALLKLAGGAAVRGMLAAALARAGKRFNTRMMARWYSWRARAEIAELNARQRREPPGHFSWVSNGSRFMALRPTSEALVNWQPVKVAAPDTIKWPEDLEYASAD
jgi:nucleoside-diphosphate-sugar epimerase